MEGSNEEQKQNARKRIVNIIIRLFGVNGYIDSNGILSFINSIITNEDAGLRPPERVINFILDDVQPMIEREAGLLADPDELIRLFDTINDLIKQRCDFNFSDLIERFTQNLLLQRAEEITEQLFDFLRGNNQNIPLNRLRIFLGGVIHVYPNGIGNARDVEQALGEISGSLNPDGSMNRERFGYLLHSIENALINPPVSLFAPRPQYNFFDWLDRVVHAGDFGRMTLPQFYGRPSRRPLRSIFDEAAPPQVQNNYNYEQ